MHVPVAAVAAVALMKVFGCAWYSWDILGYLGISWDTPTWVALGSPRNVQIVTSICKSRINGATSLATSRRF